MLNQNYMCVVRGWILCIYGNYPAWRNPIYDDILQVYDATATYLLSGGN